VEETMVKRVVAVVVSGLVLGLAALVLPMTTSPSAGAEDGKPSRVLILVIDAFRPDYIERFNMGNVKALMQRGTSFPNGIVGHMAAETVISHSVMTSGLFPKHMGWSNEVFRDVGNRLGGGAGAYYVTSSMSCDQFRKLSVAGGYPRLSDYLDRKYQDGKFFAIGQKPTATCTAGQPADADDSIITFSSRAFDCDGDGVRNWRGPTGVNVPLYISQPECGRYYVNSDSNLDYGTKTTPPAWMYPLDGNRFVPGYDPAHLGGDVWTADAAVAVMRNEPDDWRGMLVSMGDVDKAGHMWGPNDAASTANVDEQARLRFAAKSADEQVGKIMAALEEQKLTDDTLVVLTTDHAVQQAERYHGVNAAGRSDFNWYYGTEAPPESETYLSPSPSIQPMIDTGNIDFMYQDGHIAAWLKNRSPEDLEQGAQVMRTLPDVTATYYRDGESHYELDWAGGKATAAERRWWAQHQNLVQTMAAPYGPDVVGLLRDRTSYGVAGDHGGHQREIQRIPIIFAGPGVEQGATPGQEARLVDLLPTTLDLMGVDPSYPLDGTVLPVHQREGG
jgi:predicted AlkP superfamily pyrophosphatase or phosphodiesterase